MADTLKPIKCPACGNTMEKVFIPSAGINLDICTDGCGGIYISSERNGSTLTLTAHALNNKPTANVTIQVTLTKVRDLNE